MILVVVPITTATVHRSFSDMTLVKTRLRNHLGDTSLDHTMRVSIEGPVTLDNAKFRLYSNQWKDKKKQRTLELLFQDYKDIDILGGNLSIFGMKLGGVHDWVLYLFEFVCLLLFCLSANHFDASVNSKSRRLLPH